MSSRQWKVWNPVTYRAASPPRATVLDGVSLPLGNVRCADASAGNQRPHDSTTCHGYHLAFQTSGEHQDSLGKILGGMVAIM